MIRYPHLAQRLFNVPLAILPSKAEVVTAALADRLGIVSLFGANGRPIVAAEYGFDDDQEEASLKPYQVVAGMAVIPIQGTLVQKLGTMRPYSGMTGFDGIRGNLDLAAQDERVKGIVLDIDSPGGEVAGCFDLVDAIYRMRGDKPVWAILSETAYSAAYAIASAADRIIVPRTGGTGSIGVICLHVDFSKALSKEGIAVTIIQYGDRKADGRPEIPLSEAAFDSIQRDITTMGELFVDTVARNRNISTAKVKATQAATFLGAEGVRAGLADAVMAPDEAFRSMLAELGA